MRTTSSSTSSSSSSFMRADFLFIFIIRILIHEYKYRIHSCDFPFFASHIFRLFADFTTSLRNFAHNNMAKPKRDNKPRQTAAAVAAILSIDLFAINRKLNLRMNFKNYRRLMPISVLGKCHWDNLLCAERTARLIVCAPCSFKRLRSNAFWHWVILVPEPIRFRPAFGRCEFDMRPHDGNVFLWNDWLSAYNFLCEPEIIFSGQNTKYVANLREPILQLITVTNRLIYYYVGTLCGTRTIAKCSLWWIHFVVSVLCACATYLANKRLLNKRTNRPLILAFSLLSRRKKFICSSNMLTGKTALENHREHTAHTSRTYTHTHVICERAAPAFCYLIE